MSCKDTYIKEMSYVVIKDNSGNIIAQYMNRRNKCRAMFDRELVLIHNVPANQVNNVQVYVNNKRVR